MDWRSVKLRPRSSVAVVAIAKAEVSRRDTAALAMATTLGPAALGYGGHNRVDGPLVYWLQSV